jgi:ABC-type nitrate/sulfonate/bicarbonate transport system ATPase subunit
MRRMSETPAAPAPQPAPPTAPAAPQTALVLPPRVEFENVSVKYGVEGGPQVEAVRDVTLRVDDKPGVGEMVVFLGPSGCGKSTLLKVVAGLLFPSKGSVRVRGRPVTGPGPDRGMVFQAYTSFAWRTVRGNVEYGLELRGVAKDERRRQALEILQAVGLAEFANAYPKALSGGMKQRVAIARSLVNKPDVLLMDEPFGALDPQTRWSMQSLILDVVRKADNTVLFVTHDVAEAVYLADTVYVLSARPAQIVRRLDVPFFAERDMALRKSAEFKRIEQELLDALHTGGVKGNIRLGV